MSVLGRTNRWLRQNRRHVPAGALVLGFLWDIFTIGRPDGIYENLILAGYLTLVTGAIIFLNIRRKEGTPDSLYLLGLIQFCFGTLTGSLLVLYAKSGTIAGSALFFLLFGAFLVGNEFLRSHYTRVHFHLSVWFLLLLSYFALITPVILGKLGTSIFVLSTVISFLVALGLIWILYLVSTQTIIRRLRDIALSLLIIFVIFNALYFTNTLPPVPLALTTIGVYHSIEKGANEYKGVYENPRWFEVFRDTSGLFSIRRGEGGYCFSAIYAPVGLTARVYHRWEERDENGEWQTRSRIPFTLTGGRESGFRGYTIKTNLRAGVWRCSVETEQGALIGRTRFLVTEIPESRVLPGRLEKSL